MPTAVYIVDDEGLIRGFNKKACEFWGRTPKILDPDNRFCGALKLFHTDGAELPHRETPMAAAIHTGASCKNTEVMILRPDGTSITVSVNITPLRDQSGKIIGAINAFQDISEVFESRRKIEANRLELERRDAFLSICSHELKTPLTILLMQSQMLQRRIEKKGDIVFEHERIKLMIAQNERQYNRLIRLVDDMLDLHRIKSGKLTMHFEKTDLVALVREVANNNLERLDDSATKIDIEFDEVIEGDFDRQRLEQVLSNLIGNAIKYGIDTPVHIAITKIADQVRIQVKNQGIGIAKADQDRIFERFERVSSQTNIGGFGLGRNNLAGLGLLLTECANKILEIAVQIEKVEKG